MFGSKQRSSAHSRRRVSGSAVHSKDSSPAERRTPNNIILPIREQRFDRGYDVTCIVIGGDSMWRTTIEKRTLVSSPTLYARIMAGVYRTFSYVFALEVIVDDSMKTLVSSRTLARTSCSCCIIRGDDS